MKPRPSAVEKMSVLSSSPLFEMLSNQELEYVAELSLPKRYSAGQVIFEEGELGDSLFVIAQGEVEVLHRATKGEPAVIASLSPPEFFGEMSLIDKEYRSATVRAKTDAELLHLTAENLTTFRKQYRDGFTFVVINIARVLSSRLREANVRLRPHP
ncbi:MAG: cyclic nucleotide-binding domain-containing protein [Myxococcaceae bacterium]